MPNIPLYHFLVILMPGYLLLYSVFHLLGIFFGFDVNFSELSFTDQALLFVLTYIFGIILQRIRFFPEGVVDWLLRYPSFKKILLDFDQTIITDLEANYKLLYHQSITEVDSNDFNFDTIHLRRIEKFIQLSGDWSTIEGMRLLKFFLENVMTALFTIAIIFIGCILYNFLVSDFLLFTPIILKLKTLLMPASIFIIITGGISWYFPSLCRAYLLAVVHHFNADVTRINLSNLIK